MSHLFKGLLLGVCLLVAHLSWAKKEPNIVYVDAPFLELHTGPGRGYPIFHIAEKGEKLELRKVRTDWFLVQLENDVEGWVHRDQIQFTVSASGEPFELKKYGRQDYRQKHLEFAIKTGDFSGATSLHLELGYHFTENLATDLILGQAIGDFSNNYFWALRITNQPFPNWRISPYLGIGAGVIKTEPSATLVETEDREDSHLMATAGLRTYLSRRFLLKVEYNNYTILTNRNENEEINEWVAGFSVYF